MQHCCINKKSTNRRRWTIEELNYLSINRIKGSRQLARDLRRSESSVRTMASRCGVRLTLAPATTDYLQPCPICGKLKSLVEGEGACLACTEKKIREQAKAEHAAKQREYMREKARMQNRVRQARFKQKRREEKRRNESI